MGVGFRPPRLAADVLVQPHQRAQPPPQKPISYGNAFDALYASYEAEEADKLAALAPRDEMWWVDNPLYVAQRSHRRRVTGRQRLVGACRPHAPLPFEATPDTRTCRPS